MENLEPFDLGSPKTYDKLEKSASHKPVKDLSNAELLMHMSQKCHLPIPYKEIVKKLTSKIVPPKIFAENAQKLIKYADLLASRVNPDGTNYFSKFKEKLSEAEKKVKDLWTEKYAPKAKMTMAKFSSQLQKCGCELHQYKNMAARRMKEAKNLTFDRVRTAANNIVYGEKTAGPLKPFLDKLESETVTPATKTPSK